MTDKTFVITTDDRNYTELIECSNREIKTQLLKAFRAREEFLDVSCKDMDNINFFDLKFIIIDALSEYERKYNDMAAIKRSLYDDID